MSDSILQPAAPTAPPAPYVGGKRRLARTLIERIAAVPHTAYVEPFLGMGGVFLRRPFRARAEVVNDISRDVATLFRCLQRHYVPLMDMLRWQIASRAEFERLMEARPDTLTDLERAVRLLYLQRTAFGAKVTGRNFGIRRLEPAGFNVAKLGPVLDEVHERLCGVTIECLPWERLIAQYDSPQTLFYLDPPYYGCERDYGDGVFGRADFERLAAALGQLRGRFILSLNDRPEVRRIFADFVLEEVQTTYTLARKKGDGRVGELIISSP